MNLLFDATWIGTHYKQNAMHGGLRVIYELTKRLEKIEEIELYYSSNRYDQDIINNLISYAKENNLSNPQKRIANNQTDLFHFFYFLSLKKDSFLKKKFKIDEQNFLNHFNKEILKKTDIYHSPIEAIPDVIKSYKNIKTVFTSHDLMPFTRPDLAPVSFFETLKPAYDSIDSKTRIICVSEFTKSELLNYRKDLMESQIDVVYLGADKNIFFPNYDVIKFVELSEKYQFNFEKYFLCLNRNQKYKNTEHIIESYISLIKGNSIRDLGLVLIGTFDSDDNRNIMKGKYKEYRNIHFIEYVPDFELSVFFSNALCFVYMSLYEGFGLPIIEAMQCGTAVISSNQASLPEVVKGFGVCIDPFDKDLLSSQMLCVFNNSELQKELSAKSIERSNFFSWDKNVMETLEVYKKAIKS